MNALRVNVGHMGERGYIKTINPCRKKRNIILYKQGFEKEANVGRINHVVLILQYRNRNNMSQNDFEVAYKLINLVFHSE